MAPLKTSKTDQDRLAEDSASHSGLTDDELDEAERRAFPPCAVDGCDRTASQPPCLDNAGRPICRACAVISADQRCSYCRRRFDSAYALDELYCRTALAREFMGKALCVACWSGLGYADPGFRDDDSTVRDSWSGR